MCLAQELCRAVISLHPNNGGSHHVDLDLPSDLIARREARKAFAEAAHDALTESDHCEMTMLVELDQRVIYRGRISFDSDDVSAENDRAKET